MPQSIVPRDQEPQHRVRWLCPTAADRTRMLDMGPRILRARTIAATATGAGMLAAAASGQLPWWGLGLFAAGVANLGTLERRIARAKRPELVVAASLLLNIWLLGGAAALARGGVTPLLALLVIPVPMAAVRFRAKVVWGFAGCAALAAVVLVLIGGGVHQSIDDPLPLIGVLVLLIAVTASSTALMDAELQFRSESVLDPLTGLLNRSCLEARFAEIGEQARHAHEPVCMIMCDLDNFKRVNDRHGHERGDVVLRAACQQMRDCLRSFELFYRVGGEEFLVLLPGVDLPGGIEKAQRLRAAVQESRPGDLAVTASFGVSVATAEDIDFHSLYTAADDALYRAKAAGRNRVVAFETLPRSNHDAAAPSRREPSVSAFVDAASDRAHTGALP